MARLSTHKRVARPQTNNTLTLKTPATPGPVRKPCSALPALGLDRGDAVGEFRSHGVVEGQLPLAHDGGTVQVHAELREARKLMCQGFRRRPGLALRHHPVGQSHRQGLAGGDGGYGRSESCPWRGSVRSDAAGARCRRR